ncbi:MAG: zinc-ribbon domain-containing protein, partial [Eubacteriales bacterium]
MVCRGCGREIAENARFCVHCGASVENGEQTERFCSVCGSPLHRESAFCPKCGAQQRKVRTQSAADGMNAMSWK